MSPLAEDAVWAIYPFNAEQGDEISLNVGEKVIVIERDEQFQDGWWKGRNEKGQEGIFPESYVSKNKPIGRSHAGRPPSTISRVSEESHGADSTRTGPLMGTSLAQALGEDDVGSTSSAPHHTPLSASAPASALANSRSADSNVDPSSIAARSAEQARRDSMASFDSTGGDESTLPNLSKSQNWADSNNARSTLAQRAKAQIEKAHQERQAKQQQQLYDNQSFAGSYSNLPPEGLEFSDDSDDEDFGAGLVSQGERTTDSVLDPAHPHVPAPPSATLPETPESPTEPYEDAGLPGALPATPRLEPNPVTTESTGTAPEPVAEGLNQAGDASQYSVQTEKDLSQAPSSEEDAVKNVAATGPLALEEPTTQTHASTTASTYPQISRTSPEPPMLDQIVEDPQNKDAHDKELKSHRLEDQPIENPIPQQLTPSEPVLPSSSSSISCVSNVSDTSTTNGMAAHFPQPPVPLEAAIVKDVPQTESLSRDEPSSLPTETESSNLPATSSVTAEPLTYIPVADPTPVLPQQGFTQAPETPITEATNTRPNSQLDSSAYGQPLSIRTQDTSPRSSLASKAVPASDPRTWTVDQVVDWGRSKGYDSYILGKLAEHEISGDVLVDMDTNTLKEIDIPAFGRRVQIYKNIKELRRFYEPVPQRSTSQLGSRSSSTSMASPSMSGYDPDTPNTGAGFSPLPSLDTSGTDQFNFSNSPDVSRTSYGSIDMIARENFMAQTNGTPRGLGLEDAYEQPAVLSSASVTPGVQTSTPPQDRHVHPLSASARPAGEHQDDTEVEDRQVLSDNDAVYEEKKRESTALQSPDLNASKPSSPSVASPRPSLAKPGTENKRSSWYQPSNDLGKSLSASKFAGSQIFGSGRKARKPVPEASSIMAESMSASTSGKGKNRLSLSTMGRSSARFFRSTSGDEKTESAPARTKTISSPTVRRQVPQPPSALQRTNSQERAYDWVDQHDGPTVMSAPDPLAQIGEPEVDGWLMKKNPRYSTWKTRYVVVKNMNIYILKSPKETKVKGWIPTKGYTIKPDPDTARNAYGFKMEHPTLPSHSFASEDHRVIRKFQIILMKGTIRRDWNSETYSSSKVPTMTLEEAQAMYPPPRPPSPNSRSSIQAASRANVDASTLSARDAQLLGQAIKSPNSVPASPVASRQPPLSASSQKSNRFSIIKGGTLSRSTSNFFSSGGGTRDSSQMSSPVDSPQEVLSNQLLGVNQQRAFQEKEKSSGLTEPQIPPVQEAAATPAQTDVHTGDSLLGWVNENLPADCPKATSFAQSFRSGQLIYGLVKAKSGQIKVELEAPEVFSKVAKDGGFDHIETVLDLFDFLLEQRIDTDNISMNDLLNGHEGSTMKLVSNIRKRYDN